AWALGIPRLAAGGPPHGHLPPDRPPPPGPGATPDDHEKVSIRSRRLTSRWVDPAPRPGRRARPATRSPWARTGSAKPHRGRGRERRHPEASWTTEKVPPMTGRHVATAGPMSFPISLPSTLTDGSLTKAGIAAALVTASAAAV